jgi:hypothetical protein
MGPSRFTSHPKEGVLRILSPLKSIASAVFETATAGSSGEHTNHYTTEATTDALIGVKTLRPLPYHLTDYTINCTPLTVQRNK